MKEQQIINAYEIAKERYAKLGIDTDAVMETYSLYLCLCTAAGRTM